VVWRVRGHHRDLESFPTRRSSDLDHVTGAPVDRQVHLGDDAAVLVGRGDETWLTVRVGDVADVRHVRVPADDGVDRRVQALSDLDRKSTRLNSSHVKISYAVFCLK